MINNTRLICLIRALLPFLQYQPLNANLASWSLQAAHWSKQKAVIKWYGILSDKEPQYTKKKTTLPNECCNIPFYTILIIAIVYINSPEILD